MFCRVMQLLRIYILFLIIRKLNKDLCTKIVLMVMRNGNQNKYFGKIDNVHKNHDINK